jgi:hypothetical protein
VGAVAGAGPSGAGVDEGATGGPLGAGARAEGAVVPADDATGAGREPEAEAPALGRGVTGETGAFA